MTDNKGLDFIKHVRSRPDTELAKRVADTIGIVGTGLLTAGSWMSGCLFGLEANIDWLPGNSINHNGHWDGEGLYNLGYLIGFPVLGAAASFGIGKVVGKGVEKVASFLRLPNESDTNFEAVYDSLSELVKDDDNFRESNEFRALPPVHQDALRIERLSDLLTRGEVSAVQEITNELGAGDTNDYASGLINTHLESLAVDELPSYDTFLREDELVRMTDSYMGEGRLADAEMLTCDRRISDETRDDILGTVASQYISENNLEDAERIGREGEITSETQNSILNKIGDVYLSQGQLQRAEELWRSTENYEMIKGPLLDAYKNEGNSRKVAELHVLNA